MRLVSVVALLLICGQASAGQKECDGFATLAHNIMAARQSGVSMRESMGINERSNVPDALKEVVKGIIVSAYEQPRYSTEQMKARAISEFENGYYLACVKT